MAKPLASWDILSNKNNFYSCSAYTSNKTSNDNLGVSNNRT